MEKTVQTQEPGMKITALVAVSFVTIFITSLILNKAFGSHAAKNFFPYSALIVTIAVSYRHKQLSEMSYGKLMFFGVAGGIVATLLLQLINLF